MKQGRDSPDIPALNSNENSSVELSTESGTSAPAAEAASAPEHEPYNTNRTAPSPPGRMSEDAATITQHPKEDEAEVPAWNIKTHSRLPSAPRE